MSIVLELVGALVADLFMFILGPGFHATGRLLIFLFTLGYVRIPPLRHGGAGGEGWLDFGAQAAGFVFWVAVLVLTIYLLVA